MNWLDIPILIFLGIITTAGVYRGFISELFDILILTVGTSLSILLFSLIGGLIKSITGFESKGIYTLIWILVFAAIGVTLFVVGMRVDEKLSVTFPKKWWKILGGTMAALKGFLILFIVLLFIGNLVTTGDMVHVFKNSAFVTNIQGMEPSIESIVIAITPDQFKDSFQGFMRNSVYLEKK